MTNKIRVLEKNLLVMIIIVVAFLLIQNFSFADSIEVNEDEDLETSINYDHKLERIIKDYLEDKKGEFSFYIIDLVTGEETSINETIMTSASIIKTYLIVEVHKQIKEGKISFNDRLTLKDKYRVNGSGILAKEKDGTKYSVRYLLDLVITISDNVAANMLAEYVDLRKINETIKSFGIEDSRFGHLIVSKERTRYSYGWNETTTKDLATIYHKIYDHTCLGQVYDDKLINLFRKCKSNYKIPELLPDSVRVSHKTGSLPLYEHDAGIVFNENRDYIIAAMSRNLKSNKDGQKIIAEVSKLTYDYMVKKDIKERTGILKKSSGRLFLNNKKMDLYDFKGEAVVEINQLLSDNFLYKEMGNKIYFDLPAINFEDTVSDSCTISPTYNFDDMEAMYRRNQILISGKESNLVSSGDNLFIYVDDLYELGSIVKRSSDYYMEKYAGTIYKSDKKVTLLDQEIIYYDINGETYIPLGFYYLYNTPNSKDAIKKYNDYLLSKKENNEKFKDIKNGEKIGMAEFLKLDYKSDIDKHNILSVDGNFVIGIKELEML